MGLDMGIYVNGEEEIYMRKENAIRNWFATHLDNFKDNDFTPISKLKFESLVWDMRAVVRTGMVSDLYKHYVDYKENDSYSWEDIHFEWELFAENNSAKYKTFCRVAENIFPTQSGFFFGSTEYDEKYIQQLFVYLYKFEKLYEEVNWEKDVVKYWESY